MCKLNWVLPRDVISITLTGENVRLDLIMCLCTYSTVCTVFTFTTVEYRLGVNQFHRSTLRADRQTDHRIVKSYLPSLSPDDQDMSLSPQPQPQSQHFSRPNSSENLISHSDPRLSHLTYLPAHDHSSCQPPSQPDSSQPQSHSSFTDDPPSVSLPPSRSDLSSVSPASCASLKALNVIDSSHNNDLSHHPSLLIDPIQDSNGLINSPDRFSPLRSNDKDHHMGKSRKRSAEAPASSTLSSPCSVISRLSRLSLAPLLTDPYSRLRLINFGIPSKTRC